MTRRRLVLLIAAAVALVVAGVASAYGYERSRDGVIADGVTIGGLDVGGLDAAGAERKVGEALASARRAHLVVRSVHSRFTLRRSDFGVSADVEPAVRDALARSQRGGFLTRAWRDLVGGKVDATVELPVRYSNARVDYLVRGLRRSIDRRPENARLVVSVTSLRVLPGSWGRRVRAATFRRELVAWLVSTRSPRLLRVPTEIVLPLVTERRLVARNAFYITIDRNQKRLRLFRRLRLAKAYTISVGRIGLETPAGFYHIRTKAANPAWYVPRTSWAGSLAGKIIPGGAPDNPIKARWLGFYDGSGIHGTDDIASLGTAASHGCIRMSIPDVIELYKIVPVGTRIYIV
jgi:hypothetical protein